MDFLEFKEKCLSSDRVKKLNEKMLIQMNKELESASYFFEAKRDLFQEFEKASYIDNRYVLPYILGFTENLDETKKPRKVQIKKGASGGIDVDSDFQGIGREKIINYLRNKYGRDCVLNVGTFSSLGPSSAAKDLLRVYGIEFAESNEFTAVLEKELTWEDNIKKIKTDFPKQYQFYLKNQKILDLVPSFINKIRQSGKHAGGIVILPKPVWNYIPVERVSDELATAFPESGSEQVLDELGIIKYDILSISILDVIGSTIKMIEEKIFKIEEDGIIKIVPESYLKGKEIVNEFTQ